MPATIEEYNKKRHFDKTREPSGKLPAKPRRAKPLRFVVQHHLASHDHYDFRLEWDGVLKSWAVPKGPSYSSRDKRLAVQVEDHPLEYRNFEGTIPKGQYGGGTVMLWDEGTFTPITDIGQGLADGSLKFTLDGDRLRGKWALVHMKPRPGEKDRNWLLIKEKDDYEGAFDVQKFSTSVRTGRTMAEIGAGETEKETDMKSSAPAKASKSKKPKATGKKTAAGKADDITITHPEKVLYPKTGITKGDVAAYYRKMAPRMLPYVENRVLSVVRCPGGIDSACFFKKHPAGDSRGLSVIEIPVKEGADEYYYITGADGLLNEVQMNTLEFHVWGSRVKTLEKPDVMVFDLDPDEGLGLAQVRQGVKDLKGLLDQLALTSYLKTSGGKGYHVVVPFKPHAQWDSFYGFAQNTAKTMEAMWPDRYTSNQRKVQRKGKIFIDWMRNGRGATSIAPYSVRAKEGVSVSMPIGWNELEKVAPADISMQDAVKRLRRKDPWGDFFETSQRLNKDML